MKKVIIFFILVMSLFSLAYGEGSSNYDLEINIGNKGTVYIDKKIAINISIRNNSDDFDGVLRVLIPLQTNSQDKSYYSYDYIVQIPSGESKSIESLETPDQLIESGDAIIQLVNKNDKFEFEKKYKIRKSYDNKTTVAILSEDFDSLSYIKSSNTYELINLQDMNLELDSSFSLYDVVFINFYETSKLSDKTIESLEKFVIDGGQLVIGTGQYMDKSLKKLDFIGDLSISGSHEVSHLELQEITGVKLNTTSTIKVADIETSDYHEVNSLVLKKKLGLGSIVLTKLSLADDVFKSYLGSDNFINSFTDFKTVSKDIKYRNNTNYYVNNYISKIPKQFMPNPGVLAIFMFIFVILIGPATYIVLNHFDKRDYGFIVIIAIVIVSIAGIKVYGYSINSSSDIVNHLSLLRADGDTLSVESYIGFKGSKGDVDISFDKKDEISRFVVNNYNLDSGYIYSKYTNEDNHIVFHNSKQWEFNNIKVNRSESFNSKLVSPIYVDGNRLKFDFKNELAYNIDAMFLVYGENIFYKSELAKGDHFIFDDDLSVMYKSNASNVVNSLYGYNSVLGFNEDYLKNDVLSGFFSSMKNDESSAFLLLETGDYSVGLNGDKDMKEQKLAYIYIPLEVIFKAGENVKAKSGIFKANVVESSGIEYNGYNDFYNGSGFITFEYKAPESVDVRSFELNLYTSTNDMFYEVYNINADIWEKVDSSNFIVTDEKVDNYYDGSIKVRATANNYVDFESPKFSFEGVGK